jgi:hypothetical protein
LLALALSILLLLVAVEVLLSEVVAGVRVDIELRQHHNFRLELLTP